MMGSCFSIKIFSILQDVLGTNSLEIRSAETVVVGDLIDKACARHPALEAYRPYFRVAVNLEYVQDSHPVKPDDEIAILMPASGG
jgi:molybdopterin converting factor small subunit